MKGLLIKDFHIIKNQIYFLLIVTGCAVVFMVNGSAQFGLSYICAMSALLSSTTVSYDEYENGTSFLLTLPVTRKEYVKEKYLFAGILLLIGLVISVIAWGVTALTGADQISGSEMISCCAGGITAGIVMLSVVLPAQLKYGAEKGRIVLAAMAAFIVAAGMAVSGLEDKVKAVNLFKNILRQADRLDDKAVLGIVALIWVLICAVSVWIAEKVMEKREF